MKLKGFSLIELMVVIAIIALLAAYAVPSYRQYVIESKRTVAHNKILEIAGAFEKFYANTNGYPDGLTGGGDSLSLSADFLAEEDYSFSVDATDAGGWVITATAKGSQSTDSKCPTITFNNLGQKGPANTECWND